MPLLDQYHTICYCWINTIRMVTNAIAGSIPSRWEPMPLLDQDHQDGNKCHCWIDAMRMRPLDPNNLDGNKCHSWIKTIRMGIHTCAGSIPTGWEQKPLLDHYSQIGNKCHPAIDDSWMCKFNVLNASNNWRRVPSSHYRWLDVGI